MLNLLLEIMGAPEATSREGKEALYQTLSSLFLAAKEELDASEKELSEPEMLRMRSLLQGIGLTMEAGTILGVQGVLGVLTGVLVASSMTMLASRDARAHFLERLEEQPDCEDSSDEAMACIAALAAEISDAAMDMVAIQREEDGKFEPLRPRAPTAPRDVSEMSQEGRAKMHELLMAGKVVFPDTVKADMAERGLTEEEIIEALRKGLLNS